MSKINFFPQKAKISTIIKDGDLNLGGYKMIGDVQGDVDFTGISTDFEFKGRTVRGINKLTCNDYFGAFLAVASDDNPETYVSSDVVSVPENLGINLIPETRFVIPTNYHTIVARLKITYVPYSSEKSVNKMHLKLMDLTANTIFNLGNNLQDFSGQTLYINADLAFIPGHEYMLCNYVEGGLLSSITIMSLVISRTDTDISKSLGFSWEGWQA